MPSNGVMAFKLSGGFMEPLSQRGRVSIKEESEALGCFR